MAKSREVALACNVGLLWLDIWLRFRSHLIICQITATREYVKVTLFFVEPREIAVKSSRVSFSCGSIFTTVLFFGKGQQETVNLAFRSNPESKEDVFLHTEHQILAMNNQPFPGYWQPEGAPEGVMDGYRWTVHPGDVVYATASELAGPNGGQQLSFYFNMRATESLLRWLESQHTAVNDLALIWRRQMEGAADDIQLEYWAEDGSFSPRLRVRLPGWQGYNAQMWYQEINRFFTTLANTCCHLASHIVDNAHPQQIAQGDPVAAAAVTRHIHDLCPLMGSTHRRILTDYVMSPAGVAHIQQLPGPGNAAPGAAV